MKNLFLVCVSLFFTHIVHSGTTPTIKFIENKNQWEKAIHYRAQINGGYMYLTDGGFSFQFFDYNKINRQHHRQDFTIDESGQVHTENEQIDALHIAVSFLNANKVIPEALYPSDEYYNYFLGNDPSRWASKAHAYSEIQYKNFYEGIDLKVYSTGPHGKYDFIVSPGHDPAQIQWRYSGADSLYLDNGNLYAVNNLADVIERKPYAYQKKGDRIYTIPVEFVLTDNNTLQYYFPQGYDTCYELVIDPTLIFSAYSGSTQDNWGNTATYDKYGNVYSGGIVSTSISTGFPVTTGAYQVQARGGQWDVGILKYDSSGSRLLYATYLGGNSTEVPQSLVVDNNDELLILGVTGSSNFPVTTGISFKGGISIDPLGGIPINGSDIFISKLSFDGGTLNASTFFGGSLNDGVNFISGNMGTNNKIESPLGKNYGDQLRGDIVVDTDNNVFIASNTLSNNLSAATNSFAGGSHDAVVARFTPSLGIVWSRYVGGTNTDVAYSIKLKENTLLVAGGTNSNTIVGMNGYKTANTGNIDGWIAEILLDGSAVVNGTYLGTNAYDQIYFIDVNTIGEVYAYGQTQGSYPVQGNVYRNSGGGQFIHKLSSDLKTSLLSTTIGSGGNFPNISPTAFLVSDCNYLYLSGWGGAINTTVLQTNNGTITRNYVGGNTFNMPITTDAYQRITNGNDFYLMVLSADASQLLYATYLGGNVSRTHVDGGTSRFDKRGIVYHAVCAGCGGNSDFPAVNVTGIHRQNRSTNCNNAVFKFDLSSLKARLQTNNLSRSSPGINRVCIPDPIVFQNLSIGGQTFEWDLGDGTKITRSDTAKVIHYYKQPGTYTVTLTAFDKGTCIGKDIVTKIITVDIAQSSAQNDDVMCENDSYQLKAEGGATYSWKTIMGESVSTQEKPTVSPKETTRYVVMITEASGCYRTDTVKLTVVPAILPEFKLVREWVCQGRPYLSLENPQADNPDYSFTFDFGDGSTSDLPALQHTYTTDSMYQVKLIAQREFCVYESVQPVGISSIIIPNIITPKERDGKNDTFVVQYGKQGQTPAQAGLNVKLVVYNRWGNVVYESNNYQYDWAADNLASGVYFYELTIADYITCKDWLHIVK